MRAHLERITALNPRINAILTLAHAAEEGARRAEAAAMTMGMARRASQVAEELLAKCTELGLWVAAMALRTELKRVK